MYLQFYELKAHPFKTNPDPKFLWLGEKHNEAFATLEYGILMRNGFILLTGGIGTGKTTLIRHLMNKISKQFRVATIFDPDMPFLGFFNYLSEELGMNGKFDNKSDFLIGFREFLVKANMEGRSVFIIIDEAQRLSQELLEQIRLLSNIELDDEKLINIFFVGQSEFRETLMKKGNESISQRMTLSYHIQPLNESETINYIEHRVKVAGSRRSIFTIQASKTVHSLSGGIPRLINSICDCALLNGFISDREVITQALINACQADLRIPLATVAKQRQAIEDAKSTAI